MKFLEALKFWDKKEQITGFGAIDSLGKAHLMADKGMLEPIYLKPVRFGGTETPENRVYLPIGIRKIKEKHDFEIDKLLEEHPDLVYSCLPMYKGMSRIPYELTVSAHTPEPEKTCLYEAKVSIW